MKKVIILILMMILLSGCTNKNVLTIIKNKVDVFIIAIIK